jgi:hypothetical protein
MGIPLLHPRGEPFRLDARSQAVASPSGQRVSVRWAGHEPVGPQCGLEDMPMSCPMLCFEAGVSTPLLAW